MEIKTSSELKQQAITQLARRWKGIIIPNIIRMVIASIILYFISKFITNKAFVSLLVNLILSPLQLGLIAYGIRFANYDESLDIKDVFDGYDRWLDAFILNITIEFFILLWGLLFIIPGIIKSYSYSMSYHILADNPNMKVKDALDWSKKITQGNKMRLFCLDLSFLGWFFLSILTLGIGYIWLVPYIQITTVNMYTNLKQNNSEYNSICENALSSKEYIDMRTNN